MGQADLSRGDGTLAPYPGLAATLVHGMDFFDRPSGVVIPQFASSLSASLDPQSTSSASQNSSGDQDACASTTTTSSRDYDHFSDRVASPVPATSAYDGFSDVVGSENALRNIAGPFIGAVASPLVGQGTSGDLFAAAASDGGPRNGVGPLPNAVASPLVDPGPRNSASDGTPSPNPVRGSSSGIAIASSTGPVAGNNATFQGDQRTPAAGRPAASEATISTTSGGTNITAPEPTAPGGTNPAGQRRLSNGLTPAEHVAANRATGKAEELFRKGEVEAAGLEALDQPMFESNGERFRLDFLVRQPGADPATARRIEVKSSDTAPLTQKQKRGMANSKIFGARLITSYPSVPAGTRFPPGEFEVLRPGGLSVPQIIPHIGEPPSYLHLHKESILEPGEDD
ncbi:MAG: hypothetical protein JO334_12310 [Verrucomicrobia bacterium]|nr:hypothetical protein [Verrucomicrobiota bacterium]